MAEAHHKLDRREIGEVEEQLKEAFDKHGMEGMKKHMEKSLEAWKDVPLYIGVTGRSGVGKSSFINAIRGLSEEDEGAAEVGVTETTTIVQQYPHPLNSQLIFCDLPGVGTVNFPKANYFDDQRIGIDRFDLFLILTADRFMEDDLWLAQGIKDRKKGFLFIRTKIHQDVTNTRQSKPNVFRDNPNAIEATITQIRMNCQKHMKGMFNEINNTQKIFLIDSYTRDNPLYDFDSLTETLIDKFPDLKRDAFILSLTAMTPNIIAAKEKVLRGRIWKCCLLSAIGGAVPILGVSLVLDAGIVVKEAKFYRKQLGLEEAKLAEVAKSTGMCLKTFKESLKLKSMVFSLTISGIIKMCTSLVVSEGLETAVNFVIPFLGCIIGAGMSFGSTYCTLKKILTLMGQDAKKMNEYITKQSMSTTVL